MSKLQQALRSLSIELAQFAGGSLFWPVLADSLGAYEGQPAAHAIQSLLLSQDLSRLARVEVVRASVLGTAQAAFASSSSTIYLSEHFLSVATLPQLKATLLEEIGHALQARLSPVDRQGDEGELFSMLVRGIQPSAVERQRIQNDNDQRLLTINGKTIQVEQNTFIPYETTLLFAPKYSNTSSSGSFGYAISTYSYALSGSNAAIIRTTGTTQTLQFFNGSTSKTIAISPYLPFGDVRVSGVNVAFARTDGSDMEIYRYNSSALNATPERLTDNTLLDSNPQIDGPTIIWESWDPATATNQIFRNDGTSTAQITSQSPGQTPMRKWDVQLRGSLAAWSTIDGGDYDIFINNRAGLLATRQISTSTTDDYSPVLGDNSVAWLNWNADQENLWFYNENGTPSQRGTFQVTTNQTIGKYLPAAANLAFEREELNGSVSLQLFSSSTRLTTQLSASVEPGSVQTSGNFVSWIETQNSTSNGSPIKISTLKLYNGSKTETVSTETQSPYAPIQSFLLQGSKVLFTKTVEAGSNRDLFAYESSGTTPTTTQITVGQNASIESAGINGSQILWSDTSGSLFLSKPSTKPILTFVSSSISVVEGASTPQSANLQVKLSASSTSPVTVNYQAFTNFDLTNPAYSFSDYTETSGTLTFAPGSTLQTISIPILNNDFNEQDEIFSVRLHTPVNAVLLPGQTSADVTITDTWSVTGANNSTFTLPAGVENLTLTGTTNINGVGNIGSNIIRGNSGDNRLSAGTGGNDQLIGGPGNDTYLLAVRANTFNFVTIEETSSGGTDTVIYDITGATTFANSYSMPSFVENIKLSGSATNSFNVFGNDLNNHISGNINNNTLYGGGGSDTYNCAGETSAVTVSFSSFAQATGPSIGNDTLFEIENVIGTAHNDTITGDQNNNRIRGHSGKDVLTGGAGADIFDYRILTESRLGSDLNSFDQIIDFDASTGADKFAVATAIKGFLNAPVVNALTEAGIGASLTAATFLPGYAAMFQLSAPGAITKQFVAINDSIAGFSAQNDCLIEVPFGSTISATNFVVS